MTQSVSESTGKRRVLVQSAAEVFSKKGFAATRVSDISDHAGVGKGTVYEYFSSKEELFFAVFELIKDEIRSRVDTSVSDTASAKDVMVAILHSSAEIVAEHREIFSMNLEFWAASRGSAFEDRFTTACRAMYQEYRTLTASVIRRGQLEGDFRADLDSDQVATMVVAALDGLGVQSWFDRSVDPVPATAAFTDALCRGLCGEER